MKRWLIILVLLTAAAAIGWQIRGKFHPAAAPLTLYGNVDIRGVDLGFRVAGRLLEVLRDEGDAVRAGDLLARIDAQPYAHELARAEAALAAAEADQRLKQAGYRSEDIEQARAALEESRVVAMDATRAHRRQVELVGGGGTSRQNLESAEAALDQAKQRVKVNEAKLKLLEAGFRAEEIAAAAATVAQAQAARASAALQVEDTQLKAPAAGIVLTRVLEPGAIMQAGATVISLSLEHPVWVRAYVHESELGRVPPGTKVLLTTDGRPQQPFHGKVGFVSPRAEFTPKSVETPELRTSLVYRLRIVVDDADASLRQGMPVTVSLDSTPQ
ncbi:MAG: secretion protein HlyD [Verrucomicrobia bacterium]|nr:secretion protein HlyD [Verrucomicrobiota bacterium]